MFNWLQPIGDFIGGIFGQKKRREDEEVAQLPTARNDSAWGVSNPTWTPSEDSGGSSGTGNWFTNTFGEGKWGGNPADTNDTPKFDWEAPEKKEEPLFKAPEPPKLQISQQNQDKANDPDHQLWQQGYDQAKQNGADHEEAVRLGNVYKDEQKERNERPSLLDYLNPLGKHGLFGDDNQRAFKDTVQKAVTSVTEPVEKFIDSGDKQEGFQWDDPGDYGRFAAKLPTGMVRGLVESPNKISEGITGRRVEDDGSAHDINGVQRAGAALDGFIGTAGLGFGGSGTLLKSLLNKGGAEAARQAANQAAKQGLFKFLGQGALNIGKDAAKEGLEEAVQAFGSDLADDGIVNNDVSQYAQAAGLGALGGGMLSGAGKAISAARKAATNYRTSRGQQIHNDLVDINEGVQSGDLSPNEAVSRAKQLVEDNPYKQPVVDNGVVRIRDIRNGEQPGANSTPAIPDATTQSTVQPLTVERQDVAPLEVSRTINGEGQTTNPIAQQATQTHPTPQVAQPLPNQSAVAPQESAGVETGPQETRAEVATQPAQEATPAELYNQEQSQRVATQLAGRDNKTGYQQEVETTQPEVTDSHVEQPQQPELQAPPRDENVDPETRQYINELEAERNSKPGFTERTRNFFSGLKNKAATSFVDEFHPIESKLEESPEKLALRNSIDRTLRSSGISQAYVNDNGLAKVIQGLENKQSTADFDQLLLAKHAMELRDRGVETGRDPARDAALIKSLEKRYKKELKGVQAYSQKMLDDMVDYGLIDKDTATYLKKTYPNYVPFHRILEEEAQGNGASGAKSVASLSKQNVIKRIEGGTAPLDSPLSALIQKTEMMVREGERNRTAKLLASFKDAPGNPLGLEEVTGGTQKKVRPVKDKNGNIVRNEDGSIKTEEYNASIAGKPTISFLDNGKKRTFLTTPEIARAAKGLNREQIGTIGKIVSVPTRILRFGATGINPGFAFGNVVKDFWGASINSDAPFSTLLDGKNYKDALSAAFNHKGKEYQELLREGVHGNSYDFTRNSNLNLEDVRSQRSLWDRAKRNAKPANWLSTIENTIGRSEDFGRAFQYYSNKRNVLAKGMSEADAITHAADQARNNSTNFARMGTAGRQLNLAIPYLNAGIQGQRILLKRFKENPGKYATKTFLGVVMPLTVAAAVNQSSEDMQKILKEIPDYDKEGNIFVKTGDISRDPKTGNVTGVHKIPVPPQYAALWRGIQSVVKGDPDLFKLGGDVVEQLTTVNPTTLKDNTKKYLPQAVKLLTEPTTNVNTFTGREIVPKSMENLDKKDQYDNSTSLTARKLGEMFNASPKQIDNLYRTATGGAGQILLNGIDTITKAVTGSQEEAKGRPLIDSIVGRFANPHSNSDGTIYYDELNKAIKNNKLAGRDLDVFNAVHSKKYTGNGNEIEGKSDAEEQSNSLALAHSPAAAKAIADAQKAVAERTGKPLNPLYQLSAEQQHQYYLIKGLPKDSAEQRDLEQKASGWLTPLKQHMREYYAQLSNGGGERKQNPNRVPAPQVDENTQRLLSEYGEKQGQDRYDFYRKHPEIGNYFQDLANYSNAVREAQGVAPNRTRPEPSSYVNSQMANRNFSDPAVQRYLQSKNIYDLTNIASLARMQGNDLDSKALKAAQNIAAHDLVRNPDGSYALKYPDPEGSGKNQPQEGATQVGSAGRSFGRRGGWYGQGRANTGGGVARAPRGGRSSGAARSSGGGGGSSATTTSSAQRAALSEGATAGLNSAIKNAAAGATKALGTTRAQVKQPALGTLAYRAVSPSSSTGVAKLPQLARKTKRSAVRFVRR